MSRLKEFIEKRKGITLIELLISIAILGVVLAIATTLIIQAYNIAPSGARRMSARQMAEMHVTEIARYARNANPEDIDSYSIGEEVQYNESENEIEINNNGRIFNNIIDFSIEPAGDNDYKITLEKEYDGNKGRVTTILTPRNQ